MKTLACLLFVVVSLSLAAQDLESKAYQFLFRSRDVEVAGTQGPAAIGPSSMATDGKDLFVYDQRQGKLVAMARTGVSRVWASIEPEDLGISLDTGVNLILDDSTFVFEVGANCISLVSSETRRPLSRPVYFPVGSFVTFEEARYVTLVNDLAIVEETDTTRYHAFRLPKDPDQEAEYLDPWKTREALFLLRQGPQGVHFGSRGFLFRGDQLLTRNASTFIRYVYPEGTPSGNVYTRPDNLFLGTDREGNYYWSTGWLMKIYNKDFTHKTTFWVPSEEDETRIGAFPFIDPDGNIYGQTFDLWRRVMDLYFLKRDW